MNTIEGRYAHVMIPRLEEALKKDPKNTKIMVLLAKNYQACRNITMMNKYYLMASKLGNSEAMTNLGCYYHVNNDYTQAKKYYLMAIELKNSQAMFCLGNYYQMCEMNYSEMKKYYLMAIEHNNSDALYNIANHYQHIEKNYSEMKKYFLMAIKNDRDDAMNNLGFYYQEIEKNYPEMKKYYLMAIERGKPNSNAMYNLGFHYQEVEKNYSEMKKYYLMAIEHKNHKAMYALGKYYQETEKNYLEMKNYYLMAIEYEVYEAFVNLGIYYQFIEKDYSEMKKYYSMAIEKTKSPRAMTNLGVYYRDIEKNYSEMKKYFMMAIQQNDSSAMYFLASYYEKIEQDKLLASKLYKKSATLGSLPSILKSILPFLDENENNDSIENKAAQDSSQLQIPSDCVQDSMNTLDLTSFLSKSEDAIYENYIQMAVNYAGNEEELEKLNKDLSLLLKKDNVEGIYKQGCYYEASEGNITEANKYYAMASDLNHYDASEKLAIYYDIEGKQDKMIKYYSRVMHLKSLKDWEQLSSGCPSSSPSEIKKILEDNISSPDARPVDFLQLGVYFQVIENNPVEIKKNYLEAIERGSTDAMVRMALYYRVEKNEEEYLKICNLLAPHME